MVRIRSKPVKVPDILSSIAKPIRKRKFGENTANDVAKQPSSSNGSASLRSSKRVRNTHLPYQSPESVDALLSVAARSKRAAEIQLTPKTKVKPPSNKPRPEKPVKSLKKQVRAKPKQAKPSPSVRRKLLSTPEPVKSSSKSKTVSSSKSKVKEAKNVVAKAKKARASIQKGSNSIAAVVAVSSKKRKRSRATGETNQDVVPSVGNEGKRLKKEVKKKKGKLNPKPDLTIYEKNSTYETRLEIPFISTLAHSRLLIRAVVLNDMKMLKKLVHVEPQKIYTTCMSASHNDNQDVFDYICKLENKEAFKLLHKIPEKTIEKFGSAPSLLLSNEQTGHGSTMMFGHALRQVGVGRGGKEGNDAFLYDKNLYNYGRTQYINAFNKVLERGASQEFIKFLLEQLDISFWELTNISIPLRRGHHELAGAGVAKAIERSGYGFNFLHQEALLKKTGASLTPFKPVSVVKKCTYEPRFTPLHCAAVNPNVEILTALLRSMPDYNLADGGGWTVGHYAAVCSGPEPLKYLLQFGVSIHATTSAKRGGEGYTLLHAAISAGRMHNVKTILEHEKASKESSKVGEDNEDDDDNGNSKNKQKGLLQNNILYKLTTKGENALQMACKKGHVDIVKLLLNNDIDANRPTPAKYEKLTPLMIACQLGHLDVVKVLVDGNVKLEAKDKRGRTAAAHAAMNGQTHVLSYLLRLGVNHLAIDSSGNSLLHYAAAYGWYFETMLLLEAGCPPNASNHWKMTPVAIAFMKGHTGLVEILMKQEGVDVDARIDDASGRTLLLETCCRNSDLEKIKFLIENLKADTKSEDFNGNNALHYIAGRALRENSYDFKEKIKPFNECIAYLVQAGCDPFKKNSNGKSSILLAAERNNFHFISKLLQLKIKIPFEAGDEDNKTLLHFIIEFLNSSEIVYTIFTKCLSDNSTLTAFKEMAKTYNKDGYTPFLNMLHSHRTSNIDLKTKLIKMADIFLGKLSTSVDAPVQNKSKKSALHLAIGVDYAQEVLAILLKYKPILDPLDDQSQTPLVTAVLEGIQPAAEKLIAAGADVNFKVTKENGIGLILVSAMKENQSFFLIPTLISKGADAQEVQPKTKNSLLHYIARKPTLPHAAEALNAVLQAGVNPDLVNSDGRTALHLAVNARGSETDVFYDIEDALISAGANLAIKDQRGRIPLHYAFVKIGQPTNTSFFDPIELVSSLVTAMKSSRAAGEIHSTDVFGSTPLHYSAFRGATICSSYLIQAISRNVIDLCDSNGNTPFGLAVRNCHEGCALNFYQKDADFLRTINNNIQTKEIRTEVEQPVNKPSASEPWEWNDVVEQKKEKEKLREEQQKYPLLEQVVKHNWQGLLYLMIGRLESSGVGFSTGIATALKTSRLKLALKLALRVKSKKQLSLESGTLFHNLAKSYAGSQDDLIIKLNESFRKHGLNPAALDEFGSQAILYGLMNLQTKLTDILFDNINDPMKQLASMKPDLFGRTPFTALFWNLKLETPLQPHVESWANQLVAAGAHPNQLCEYPMSLSMHPEVRFTRKLTGIIPSNASKYTPLIVAVLTKSYKTVKWLLNIKSGPNHVHINAQDSDGRTALMHAVRLNDVRMVKVLLDPYSYDYLKDVDGTKNIQVKSANINPAIRDNNGWTVMDYLIRSTGSYWQYKNIQQVFKLLQQISGAVAVTSGDGLTPLDRAVKEKRRDVVDMLAKYVTTQKQKPVVSEEYPDFAPTYSQDIVLTSIQNFPSMAEKMAEKALEKERERLKEKGIDEEMKLKPDELCGLDKDNAELVMDEKQNIPYDCLMTKVDLSYGIHGLYNFYKMQIVKQPRGKEMIILFTQWGRVGDQGQYQKTPMATEEEAIKEFSKIFKSKSGNAWEDVQNFKPIPTKYRVVKRDLRVVKKFSHVNVDFTELEKWGRNVASTLPGNTLYLMKNLCLVHRDVKSTYGRGRSFRHQMEPDYCNMPLVPMEILTKAEGMLKQISELIEQEEKMKNNDKFTELDRLEVVNKIVYLSEDFYSLIPVYGYEAQKLEPIFQHHDLRAKLEVISRLVHLELAKTLQLAAQLSQTDTNPFEYVYRCLGTKVHLLDRKNSTDLEEAEIILQYIHNTSSNNNAKVHAIYRVQRAEEELGINATKIHNRKLLWHGTSAANMLSILHQGLQVAPLGSQISGHLFGKGIYLADVFGKSQGYCRTIEVNGKNRKYMLLCEAALGKIYNVKLEDAGEKPMPSGYDSLKTADSRYEPNPESTIFWKGRTVDLGTRTEKIYKNEDSYAYGLDYNEYIIFNSNQVAMRYLIEFED